MKNDDNKCKWSDVVGRKTPQTATRTQSGSSRVLAAGTASSNVVPSTDVNQQEVTRDTVPGPRKVWGTNKDASTTVVLHTIRQLTKMDPEKRLTVKRKFKDGESGQRDRWWFLIRGSEATLGELESLWSCVSLQVGWKLEMCTKPSNDENRKSGENLDAIPNSEETSDVLKGSSNSPAPSSADNLKRLKCYVHPVQTTQKCLKDASCSNQPSIKQTTPALV